MASIILLLPKLLPYIFEQPDPVLPVYDLGDSSLLAGLQDQPALTVFKVRSQEEFDLALCNALYPEIGLLVPVDFDQVVAVSGTIEFQGFACWSKRFQVSELLPELEKQLAQSLGRPVTIDSVGNTVFPPSEGVLFMSLAALNTGRRDPDGWDCAGAEFAFRRETSEDDAGFVGITCQHQPAGHWQSPGRPVLYFGDGAGGICNFLGRCNPLECVNPCPCGSGKKYKKCHGKDEEAAAQ